MSEQEIRSALRKVCDDLDLDARCRAARAGVRSAMFPVVMTAGLAAMVAGCGEAVAEYDAPGPTTTSTTTATGGAGGAASTLYGAPGGYGATGTGAGGADGGAGGGEAGSGGTAGAGGGTGATGGVYPPYMAPDEA